MGRSTRLSPRDWPRVEPIPADDRRRDAGIQWRIVEPDWRGEPVEVALFEDEGQASHVLDILEDALELAGGGR